MAAKALELVVLTVFTLMLGMAASIAAFAPRSWIRYWRENALLPLTRQSVGDERKFADVVLTSSVGVFGLLFAAFMVVTILLIIREAR